jgi:hypothetical protein
VVAIDPFYLGESKIEPRGYLYSLLLATVGERPLGIQASQLLACARWLQRDRQSGPVSIAASGRRSCLAALAAAGLAPEPIAGLKLHASMGSLREVIEQNLSVEQAPELFCFGLLDEFDIKQLAALVAPRPVEFVEANERTRQELLGLRAWYALWGKDWNPVP